MGWRTPSLLQDTPQPYPSPTSNSVFGRSFCISTFLLAESIEQAGSKLPGVTHVAPGLSHSLHPDFYRHELSDSTDRLGCTPINAYLVEHPEHHLALKLGLAGENAAGGASPPGPVQLEEARGSFYEEMTTLFQAMEGRAGEREGGKGGAYGVSSLGMSLPTWDPMHVSWERLVECAEQAASRAGRDR